MGESGVTADNSQRVSQTKSVSFNRREGAVGCLATLVADMQVLSTERRQTTAVRGRRSNIGSWAVFGMCLFRGITLRQQVGDRGDRVTIWYHLRIPYWSNG